jgi:hypothetical protein
MLRFLIHTLTFGKNKYEIFNWMLFKQEKVVYADIPRINGFLSLRRSCQGVICKNLADGLHTTQKRINHGYL